jgi:hypothetical protein
MNAEKVEMESKHKIKKNFFDENQMFAHYILINIKNGHTIFIFKGQFLPF